MNDCFSSTTACAIIKIHSHVSILRHALWLPIVLKANIDELRHLQLFEEGNCTHTRTK
jgi:hypothetical protein